MVLGKDYFKRSKYFRSLVTLYNKPKTYEFRNPSRARFSGFFFRSPFFWFCFVETSILLGSLYGPKINKYFIMISGRPTCPNGSVALSEKLVDGGIFYSASMSTYFISYKIFAIKKDVMR